MYIYHARGADGNRTKIAFGCATFAIQSGILLTPMASARLVVKFMLRPLASGGVEAVAR